MNLAERNAARSYGGLLPPYERRSIGPTDIDKFQPTIDGIRSLWMASGSGGGGSGPFPFDVEFSAGSDLSHKTAFVRPGTINGLVPSNMTDTYDLSISGIFYLVLSGVASDGEISSSTLSMPTSAPAGLPTTIGQPPVAFDYLLGMIIGDGTTLTWYRTIGPGSLSAVGIEMFRTDKAAPAPGTLPYDLWWSWDIGVA